MKTKMKLTRLWSFLLTLVMVVGLLPTAAIPVFAVEESEEQPSVDSKGYMYAPAAASGMKMQRVM